MQVREFKVCDGAAPGGGALAFDDRQCPNAVVTHIDPQNRVLWLRAEVMIDDPASFAREPVDIFTAALASREIWWNGERIASIGTGSCPRRMSTSLRALVRSGAVSTSVPSRSKTMVAPANMAALCHTRLAAWQAAA